MGHSAALTETYPLRTYPGGYNMQMRLAEKFRATYKKPQL